MSLDPFTLLGIFIIVIIIIIYLAWMVRYKAKSKERLLIIEKDYDINKLIDKKKPLSTLKTGIILFVSSIGAVFAILIFSLFRTGIEEGVIFFTSIFNELFF